MGKTLIIAEAGVNHNGDMNLAKKMIQTAADCGADFVKFQTFKTDKLVTSTAIRAPYQKNNYDLSINQSEMLLNLELSIENHYELIECCKRSGVKFFSTGFDLESLIFLNNIGLELFKIPSGEITNYPYLRLIGSFKKPVILSTGMSSLLEVKQALEVLESEGLERNKITILHCTSAYPAPFEDINLNAMVRMRSEFGVKVGYSDHSSGVEVAIAATALGAEVIEKHFTLDRNLPGPDHQASLIPEELSKMILAIRNIEIALGDGNKLAMPSEFENMTAIRKSIVASMQINKGDLFTEFNITTKRPGNGISPMAWFEVIGQRATKNYNKDDLL